MDKTTAAIIAASLKAKTPAEDVIMGDFSDNGSPHKHTNGKKVKPSAMETGIAIHDKILGPDKTRFKAGRDAGMPTKPVTPADTLINLSTEKPVFTLDEFSHTHPGIQICSGVAYYARNGYNRHGIGTPKRFVALMGGGGESWAIYTGGIHTTSEWIESDGDKVCLEDHIKQLITCDETLPYYRF